MLTVKPWDKSQIQPIDKALRESDLGLNPQVDGDLVRIPVPPLSEQRRKDLVKLARKMGEECKVAVRHSRHDALDMLGEIKKDGGASEDEVDRAKKRVEDIVGKGVQGVDQLVGKREQDILEV